MNSLNIMEQLSNISLSRYGFVLIVLITLFVTTMAIVRTVQSLALGIRKGIVCLWIVSEVLIATTIYLILYHYDMNTKTTTVLLIVFVMLIAIRMILAYVKSNKTE